MPERLRRLEQVYERHPIYFVTACTFRRRALLANDEVHAAFLAFTHAAAPRGVWGGRYVVMPDHFHLFVVLDDSRVRLSGWMKSLKNSLSKTVRSAGFEAPHWQKGFFDPVLRGSESYSQKWLYVRENPVRAGLVAEADSWPFAGEVNDLEYRTDLIF
jgi:REP element-mobilizing transposase RayT